MEEKVGKLELEKFKPLSGAEFIAGGGGAVLGFAEVFIPMAIKTDARANSGQKIQGPLLEILTIHDLKSEAHALPKNQQSTVEQFLTQGARDRHQEIKTIEAKSPGPLDIPQSLMKMGGGATLGALILATITCAVRYRMHRVGIKREARKGISEFEDLLKKR